MRLFNKTRTIKQLRTHNEHLLHLLTSYAHELKEKCDDIDKHRTNITIDDLTTVNGVEALYPRIMIRSKNFTFGVLTKTGVIFPADDAELAYTPTEIEELIAVLQIALEQHRKTSK